MVNQVVHWEIGGADATKLRAFYHELFGWEFDVTDPSYAVTEGDGGIGGGIMQIREYMEPYVTIYVSVTDLDEALRHVKELGGEIVVPPTPIPRVGSFALFNDPEGTAIGLLRLETNG